MGENILGQSFWKSQSHRNGKLTVEIRSSLEKHCVVIIFIILLYHFYRYSNLIPFIKRE